MENYVMPNAAISDSTPLTSFHDGFENEDIDFIKELGGDKKGPILLGLTSWRKKKEIMKNARKLKGSNIFISEDLPPEVLLKRKTLVPEMMNYRMEGHHAIIKYDKLYVNGEEITISNPSVSALIEQRKKNSTIADCEIRENTKSKKKQLPAKNINTRKIHSKQIEETTKKKKTIEREKKRQITAETRNTKLKSRQKNNN
ncbi:hypothetical protein WDU94_010892 [Cyamophila willieti]